MRTKKTTMLHPSLVVHLVGVVAVAGAVAMTLLPTARAFTTSSTTTATTTTTTQLPMMIDSISSESITTAAAAAATTVVLSEVAEAGFVPDTNEVIRSGLITLVLGGGLIPALISANGAMVSTLSGRKGYIKPGEEPKKGVETYENYDPKNTFDPTMGDPKNQPYREYVLESGASGPILDKSQLLFAADPIPLVDIVAVLGRIRPQDSNKPDGTAATVAAAATARICNWSELPSATRGAFSGSEPPMWLPRKAFKVLIRRQKFTGWPVDTNTGLPLGGTDLQRAEESRIAKADAVIGDAALDAVFDSWSWGASVATPDKVTNTLKMIIKPVPAGDGSSRSNTNGIDLDAFIGAAIRGRSNTAIAAFSFIVIQLVVFGVIIIGPLVKTLTGVDLFQ